MNGSTLCPGYTGVERRRNLVLPYSGRERRSSITNGHWSDDEDPHLRHATSGDRQAFARLFDRSIDKVYQYIYYIVGDRLVAEDLTAQVFGQVWRRLQQEPHIQSSLLALLYQLARDATAEYRRLVIGLEWNHKTDPIASTLAVENEYLAALNELGDEQRQVLVLRFLIGYNTEQVAQILGQLPSAIQSLQHGGLDRLASIIGKGT